MTEETSHSLWQQAAISPSISIQKAIQTLDKVGLQILVAVDLKGKLIGTITDGDIRRGLLKGLSLSSKIEQLVNHSPLVVPCHMQSALVQQLMSVNKVRQVPIVNDSGTFVGLHLWDEINEITERKNPFVIMCGGKGTRMQPFTETCPKPMLPVGGKPMLQQIIETAKSQGFANIVLSINYLGHQIENYFGNGDNFEVNISYLREDSPLGTAGALRLLDENIEESILVSNGDVISEIKFADILDFHTRHSATATMAIKTHEWQNPFGVVELDGLEIKNLKEKPISKSYINAGVYVLQPNLSQYFPDKDAFDMPEIFENLMADKQKVVAFPMHEPWLDVGRPNDLKEAKDALENK